MKPDNTYPHTANSHKEVFIGATNGVSVVDLVSLDGLCKRIHDKFSGHVKREVRRGQALDGLDVGAEVADVDSRDRQVSGVEGKIIRRATMTTKSLRHVNTGENMEMVCTKKVARKKKK